MIKAVSLDVGGTLIAVRPSVGGIYTDVAKEHNVLTDPAVLEKRFRAAWKKRKALQKHQDKSWWEAIVSEVFEPYAFLNPQKFFADLYTRFQRADAWLVFADVVPTLTELKKRGMRLNIASNWDDRLPALLKTLELDSYFEQKIISFEVGVSKPNPIFFQRIVDLMRLKPEEILHVGDDVDEDVAGAKAAGMKFLHLNRTSQTAGAAQISNLMQLVTHLK